MKALKISLAILVVATIGYFVWKGIIAPSTPPLPSVAKNQFTDKIEKEISAIAQLPDTKFCKEAYKDINYLIGTFYKEGRLGKNLSENDQWKENLSKNLYAAYSAKFIKQAFVVFKGSEWSSENLNFIRSEYQVLKKSQFLENGSPVDNSFSKIKQILGKYDEITGFISSCKGFSYSAAELSARFPISDVKNKISRARTYKSNNLENGSVNNCTRLHNELKEISRLLFNAHVKYLDNKIYQWQGLYSNYNSQSDYANNLYKPLKSELDLMDNNIYNAADFDSEYNRLLGNINSDSKKAYSFFSKK